MADIKRLLNKRGWTGRELGIIELTNMAVTFKQALLKEEIKPVVEDAQFKKMLGGLKEPREVETYRNYISIHEWLSIQYNIAQTQFQQAQLQLSTLRSYLTEATLAEDTYNYIEKLPYILTQKQYDALKTERMESFFTTDSGEEDCPDVFSLLEWAVSYYLKRLESEPKKANPLKAIKKKYEKEPLKNEYLLSQWNTATGNGYYELEDGRRSDEITDDEWMEAQYGGRVDFLEQAKIIFSSGSQEEIDERLEELYFPTFKWTPYPDAPEGLTKWDVIAEDSLIEFFPDTEDTASLEELKAEFPELVDAMLGELDKILKTDLSSLPVSEWASAPVTYRELYNMNFLDGKLDFISSENYIFDGNQRALLHGVAIVTEESLRFHNTVDEEGNYIEPEIISTLPDRSLEAFFIESEDYAEALGTIDKSRVVLLDSYYYLLGYNYTLDKIAEVHDIPDILIFQQDTKGLEKRIDAFNEYIPMLYKSIQETDYGDKVLKARKLQVIRDFFKPINYEAVQLPEEKKKEADKLITDFSAFNPENTDRFQSILYTRPRASRILK